MQYLKMLGLAAVAAAALMAFAGAGTASADELCTEPAVNNMCPVGKQITVIEASLSGSAKLSSGGVTLDTCTAGTMHWDVSMQGTSPAPPAEHTDVDGPITSTTWGSAGTECLSTTDTIAGHLGTLTAKREGALWRSMEAVPR